MSEVLRIGFLGDLVKAQPISAQVLTPSGFICMSDVSVGTEVIGGDGVAYRVASVLSQGMKDIYRVSFCDGALVECCKDHLWMTTNRKERKKLSVPSAKTTQDISRSLIRATSGGTNHFVQYVSSVYFNPVVKQLPIHPYVLGIYLGDGSIHKGSVTISNPELDIIHKISSLLPQDDIIIAKTSNDWSIRKKIKNKTRSCTSVLLDALGLKYDCFGKFIPEAYLFASINDRIELLQGLCDSDGYVTNGSGIEYSTVSSKLRDGIVDLVLGLGGRVTWKESQGVYRKNGIKHIVSKYYRMIITFYNGIVPVTSEKHIKKWNGTQRNIGRGICKVELSGTTECKGITVNSPNNLYVTDNYIVTHGY